MATVYDINKGINRSIEFKGIKAQYITHLAIGLVALLILFATLYACGINIYICLSIIVPAAVALLGLVQHLSKKYGQFGLLKRRAAKRLPSSLQCHSRRSFTTLKPVPHGAKQAI